MKILIADDSAVIRAMLEQNLTKEKDIEIIASVSNGRKAVDSAQRVRPDLVISDIDMPEMNGLDATRLFVKQGIPVVIFSEDESAKLKAQTAGAVAFVVKPNLASMNSSFYEPFIQKIRKAATVSGAAGEQVAHAAQNHEGRVSENAISRKSKDSDSGWKMFFQHSKGQQSRTEKSAGFKVLCIGASTGGPTAVQQVLQSLGENFPLPVLYVQHIEVGADVKMVEWFNTTCRNFTVKLAVDGENAVAGTVYMAPADKHLIVDFVRTDGTPIIKLSDEAPVRFLRPAVDKLFFSAATYYGHSCLAVLLTGMGRDGADGCKMIVDVGGHTVVEDESTCAVFGMPAAAIEAGGASEVLPRPLIADKICQLVQKM